MNKEKGMTAKIEDWLAEVLAALTDGDGAAVFKTAEPWTHQLASGAESFQQFEPFAFISFWPADAAREGDYDLNDKLRFSILIGLESKVSGIARRGDDNHLGASRIRDLVVAAVEGTHPGDGFACDDFYFSGETELVDSAKRYATELHFTANWLRND